jgi:hypothetical protein
VFRGDAGEQQRRLRKLLRCTATDEQGRFEFEFLAAGVYVVRADQGNLLATMSPTQKLAHGETRAALDLVFPPSGALAGRILAPPDASFTGLRIELTRAESPAAPYVMRNARYRLTADDTLDESIEKDGGYRVGPVEAGLHHVWLSFAGAMADVMIADTRTSPGVFLGDVEIEAGRDTLRDFDLRDGFPGSLRITLRMPEPTDTYTVRKRKMESVVIVSPEFARPGVQTVSARCRDGVARIGPLAPGIWRIGVTSPAFQWNYRHPAAAVVSAGETSELTVEVPITRGIVRCVDKVTGAPLSNASVMVTWKTGGGEGGRGARTDAAGDLTLDLPPDTFGLRTFSLSDDPNEDPREGETTTLEWTMNGPSTAIVRLDVPR